MRCFLKCLCFIFFHPRVGWSFSNLFLPPDWIYSGCSSPALDIKSRQTYTVPLGLTLVDIPPMSGGLEALSSRFYWRPRGDDCEVTNKGQICYFLGVRPKKISSNPTDEFSCCWFKLHPLLIQAHRPSFIQPYITQHLSIVPL